MAADVELRQPMELETLIANCYQLLFKCYLVIGILIANYYPPLKGDSI
jgi:hypothetical protein